MQGLTLDAYRLSVAGLIMSSWSVFASFPSEWQAGTLGTRALFLTAAMNCVSQLSELVGAAAEQTAWGAFSFTKTINLGIRKAKNLSQLLKVGVCS